MADRRIILPGPDTITLSAQTADKLLRAGDGDAALLYLYVLRAGGTLSVSEAAATLRRSEGGITASLELLGRLGLLQVDGPASPPPAKEELPEYTVEDIKRELDNGTVFSSLVSEVQKSLGKLLSSEDLIKLFGLYDSLGLPPEVILHLVTYCIDECGKKYETSGGGQKRPTMRYIEKVAYTWEREGIFTLEKAEEYLKHLASRRGLEREIKSVLQIKDRELSAGERKYVDGWIALGFTPEALEMAYDKTVLKTGRLAWSYMDSIIGSWNKKGLRTVDEIIKKDGRSAAGAEQKQKTQLPAKTAPTPTDIEHMRKFLEKLREE